ncbi:MAG: hypothetical protein M1814_000009 [Vezdaea aestivalis]|nr:MAG: hypothetical protein M1814_000009 [Vezdaea aestivalis]
MDQGKSLIRMIARSFYDTKSMIVVDALMQHSALRDDDLAYLMGMQTKELRKLCSRLREDRLVTEAPRSELKDGQTRPQTRTYYFIDYHRTIDSIKWRLRQLSKRVDGTSQAVADERKDYRCPRCGARWTLLETIDSRNPSTGVFACHRCGQDLVEDDDAPGRDLAGYKDSARLQAQIEPFLKLLQAVDAADIPATDLETALAVAVPVIRDQLTNPVALARPVDKAGATGPASTKGLATVGQVMTVSVTDGKGSGIEEEEKEARKRAEGLAKMNALPEWHTKSTVTGENTALGLDAARRDAERNRGAGDEENGQAGAGEEGADAEVMAYYALMESQKAKDVVDDDEEEEEDDDDESAGDFETVVPHTNGNSTSNLAVDTPRTDDGSSQDTTAVNTPAMTGTTGKRKADGEADGHVQSVRIVDSKFAEDSAEDDDDEDEVEFEDV